jgi:thioester reductase-like protein
MAASPFKRQRTLIDFLTEGATAQPDRALYTFLDVEGRERDTYTYLAFHERTRHLAEHLKTRMGLGHGDRVLLVYPPGLEVIVAFFACARIGVIPVPVYPPTPMYFEIGLAKITFVANDSGARAALTTRGFYRSYRLLLAKRKLSAPWRRAPGLPKLEWITTDDIRGVASDGFVDDAGDELFLQYTSGSTSEPKGVVVSHRNVIENGLATLDHATVAVSWLPQYHDMGLIGYYLFPLVVGGTVYGFSPLDFLKRPALWLETVSRVRATYTSSPNFGYEYCLRRDKFPDAAAEGLDLGSLRVLMNAAEPVRPETFERFFERFEPCGLRPEAHVVAYGLAENTLCVTNHGRHIVTANKRLLQQRKLHLEPHQAKNVNQVRIVSCGAPLAGIDVRVVDPETGASLHEREIGEIWLAGGSTCSGYWRRPELTDEVFGGRLRDDPGGTRYLRTGDLGFLHEGELYVCGRIKDLIIIRGVNYYPQDIEKIVEAASPRIRTGGVAAFDAGESGEALVVLVEVRRPDDLPDPRAIARAVRTQYYVEPHVIAFVPPRTISKTTSGKTARPLTRQRWLDGAITPIATHVSAAEEEPAGDLSGLRERFQYIVELYNLTGHEEYSFAEIGIDSLTMVRLIEDIKDLLEAHGAGELVRHVDVRLLQRLTIAEFFSFLDQFERAADQPIAALRYVLTKIQEDHEAYERECMRADAILEPLTPREASSGAPVTHMLLTGPTGFFGPFLLSSLLRKTPYTFYAVVRATDPIHGLDRIRASLRRSRIWTPELDGALERRVHVVCGDVARHNLGMKSETWRALTTKVQAVCHNAALVNYVMGYDALRPANVDGTRELLRFAHSGVPKEFHLISSTFIYGWTVKAELKETDANPEMAHLDFGYAQSKWVAEQLVYAAGRQGLPVRVYRPSLISASSNGVGSRDDIAVRLLAFMINHGLGVDAKNQVSFLPADLVADNIASMVGRPAPTGTTLHATVDRYYNMADVTRVITKRYGYAFTYHDIPRFIAEMNRRATKDDLIYPLLDFFNRSQDKLAAMSHKRYNNDGYQRARAAIADARPDPALEETVAYLMEFMFREGIVQPRNRNAATNPA